MSSTATWDEDYERGNPGILGAARSLHSVSKFGAREWGPAPVQREECTWPIGFSVVAGWER